MADPVTIGLGVAKTAFSVAGANKKAKAQKEALRSKARLQNLAADEQLKQLDRELNIFDTKKEVAMGDAISSYAKAGVRISDSPLLALANTERELQSTAADIERKGLKEVELIRKGAKEIERSAGDIDPTAEIAGSILGLAGGLISKAGEE